MNPWNIYENRSEIRGLTRREASFKRESDYIKRKAPNSLSHHTVSIIDSSTLEPGINKDYDRYEGNPQNVVILNSDNREKKTIISMPGETLRHGDIVNWMGQKWMIDEKDYNSELVTKCVMTQCNYLLRWVDENGQLFECWSIVEDGTKYLTGEYEDRYFATTRGDARVAVIVPANPVTAKLDRQIRFIIDNPNSDHKMTFLLTKPAKLLTYGDEGVFKFITQEVVATDYDNDELMIADYYKYYDKETGELISTSTASSPTPEPEEGEDTSSTDKRRYWL